MYCKVSVLIYNCLSCWKLTPGVLQCCRSPVFCHFLSHLLLLCWTDEWIWLALVNRKSVCSLLCYFDIFVLNCSTPVIRSVHWALSGLNCLPTLNTSSKWQTIVSVSFIFVSNNNSVVEVLLPLVLWRSCYQQGHHFSTSTFAKFRGAVCEILWRCYPQIPYIPRPVGVVLLTENTSKYKEFIVTCNVKIHYIRPLMMKILS